ncbi:MAG: 23S rRNA (uracil(1939)-C(5))-methyltransferase RlmD [Clostridia bacterium]|nr:23S rRNA (uracil(1939)-C(5))-methyltransferase RlmD [Clostridia bacterium]
MHLKNDIIELKIDDITSEGCGVGRADDGIAVFVPFTAPGDVIDVRIEKVGKSCAWGRTVKLIEKSPMRNGSEKRGACPVYGKCGGCALRHISYDAELGIKKSWVTENFRRIGGIDPGDIEIRSTGHSDRYRNKAMYPAGTGPDGKLRFGLYAARSHRVIPCDSCMLEPEFYSDILRAAETFCGRVGLRAYEDGTNPSGTVRHLYIRDGRASGEVGVSLIMTKEKLPDAVGFVREIRNACPAVEMISVIVNKKPGNEILGDKVIKLWGKDCISDYLCGLKFNISPLSFYQVNRDGAELLYGIAAELTPIDENGTLVDLYCGAGTIGLSFARKKKIRRLYGVEIIPEAVENAKSNAALNGIEDAEFICADAGEAAVKLAADGVRPDVLVVDPPRKGCGPDVFRAVLAMKPPHITMISCNSATGARDAAEFLKMGYTVDRVLAVDMFPGTAHVETVVLITRAGS